jgi:hypothetical protein
MKVRPLSVTILSLLLIATGVGGLTLSLSDMRAQHTLGHGLVWIALLRLLAVVAGAFMLRGCNWARWLAVAWIALHVAISGLDSLQALIVHSVLLVVFAYFLFRTQTTQYFRKQNSGQAA